MCGSMSRRSVFHVVKLRTADIDHQVVLHFVHISDKFPQHSIAPKYVCGFGAYKNSTGLLYLEIMV